MTNIFNPNPLEVAVEAAHTAAIAEDAKRSKESPTVGEICGYWFDVTKALMKRETAKETK